MSDGNDGRNGAWGVQPIWVKALTLLIAVPAWIVLMVDAFTSGVGGTVKAIAVRAFATVVLLQLGFVFRAYWRMDV